MTWVDLILIAVAVAVAALAARRGWAGALMAAVGLTLVRPLLMVADMSPLAGTLLALAAGLGLALLASRINSSAAETPVGMVAGGIFGLALGAVLVLTATMSLPLQQTAAGLVYPSADLPAWLSDGVQRSMLTGYGRSVLLQPLLAVQANADPVSAMPLTSWLHDFLVIGTPWE